VREGCSTNSGLMIAPVVGSAPDLRLSIEKLTGFGFTLVEFRQGACGFGAGSLRLTIPARRSV